LVAEGKKKKKKKRKKKKNSVWLLGKRGNTKKTEFLCLAVEISRIKRTAI